jgi:EAL domain-containing protein (putative c-di-GMP-specific phosphodiesterase class I)
VYQPIVALRSGTIVGFEALTRWHHRQRGIIAPDIFIPMAEESEAIIPIGAWVLEQACRQLKRWQRAGRRLQKVAVNVSAIELAQPDVVVRATRTIESAGVPADDVWLEITEHSRLTGDLTDALKSLRAAGVHFALDDFGMSYSSLDYLQRFPVETVKIDKSFVAGMTSSAPHLGIVRAIMAIARSLQLGVIAEGIETSAQRSALLKLGCLFGQGYLYSRPLTAAEATRRLDSPAATSAGEQPA